MIEIKNRWTQKVIHTDADAETLKDAVVKAIANRADLRGAYLRGADLRGAYLEGAYLQGADLEGADLRGAYLQGADLRGADLRGADLEGAYLRGAYLQGAYLRGAYLQGADLRGADLRGAYLRGADLEGAYLEGADLRGAYLEGADLEGADLRGAYLEGADLEGAKGVKANGKSIPVTEAEYIQMRDEYQQRHPEVPVVPHLDSEICEIVKTGKGTLDMTDWHHCETSHCRAGWAIHLAGEKGYELEEKFGPRVAGGMIYRASTGRWPDFFAGTEEALVDICQWGSKEAAAALV